MATIRDLKKDIDYLTNEVINDSLLALEVHGKKVEEQVNNLINEVIEFNETLRKKINERPRGKKRHQSKKHEQKKYIKEIQKQVEEQFPVFFERISQIIASK